MADGLCDMGVAEDFAKVLYTVFNGVMLNGFETIESVIDIIYIIKHVLL